MAKWMLAALAALPVLPAAAAPRLDGVLSDHAVIQLGQPIRIGGSAEAGETVRVSLAGLSVAVKADRTGRFSATLAPLPAGGPYEMQVSARSGLTIVRDLLIGDVSSARARATWRCRSSGRRTAIPSMPPPTISFAC